MNRSPFEFIQTEVGLFNVALVALPPFPVYAAVPVPTTRETIPVLIDIIRIWLFPLSAM
jgi:hypothetical protein